MHIRRTHRPLWILLVGIATCLSTTTYGSTVPARLALSHSLLTGELLTARALHTATLLPNGLVLVVGGVRGYVSTGEFLAGAELYDPRTGRWRATGSLQTARSEHTATLLQDGRVLVVGGRGGRASVERYLFVNRQYFPMLLTP